MDSNESFNDSQEIQNAPLSDEEPNKNENRDLEQSSMKNPSNIHEKTPIGLPDEYLKPPHFETLPLDESSSTQESDDQRDNRFQLPNLTLDLNKTPKNYEHEFDSNQGGIVFSPGGSEAYVFTQANIDASFEKHTDQITPREIRDPIFVEQQTNRRNIPERSRNPISSRLEDIKLNLNYSSDRQNYNVVDNEKYKIIELSQSDADSLPSQSPRMRKGAISPSAISVASAASSTASGMLSGRKNLEWDSGADLGYVGEFQSQDNVAASLSTLEKLAIGNYTGFIENDPNKKVKKVLDSKFKLPSARKTNPEDELRQIRLHKYADSLLRHRQMNNMLGNKHLMTSTPAPKKPLKSNNSKQETTSPIHKNSTNRKIFGSPVKSSSLTDLNLIDKDIRMKDFRSNSDVSQHWFSNNLKLNVTSSEPSSCSSTTTVVPIVHEQFDNYILQSITTDPNSLPSNVQNEIRSASIEQSLSNRENKLKSRSSQLSLGSRRSESRSFETVINIGPHKKWAQKNELPSNSNDDTEEESEIKNQSSYFEHRRTSTHSEPRKVQRKEAWSARHSSAATTSDEELKAETIQKNEQRMPRTASSTLESAQIDRTKSFEYFPGENFPLQENSSSYEYLPGHMVDDRANSVLNEQSDLNMSERTSVSSSTSSEHISKKNSGKIRESSCVPDGAGCELKLIANELNERSKALLKERIRKRRHFHRKINQYIAYASLPPVSVEDFKEKQQIINQVVKLLSNEENQLEPDISKRFREFESSEESESVRKENDSSKRSDLNIVSTNTTNRSVTIGEDPSTALIVSKMKQVCNIDKESQSNDTDKKRIEQLKKLRRELKVLERLERSKLREQSNATITESENSSIVSSSTNVSDRLSQTIKSFLDLDDQNTSVKSTSMNKSSLKTKSNERSFERVSKQKSILFRSRSKGLEKESLAGTSDKYQREFGQTFPTPREAEKISKAIQTANQPKVESKPKIIKKPIAYFIPVDKNNKVKNSSLDLISITGKESPQSEKENSNILANFNEKIKEPKDSPEKIKNSVKKQSISQEKRKVFGEKRSSTLKRALESKRPEFIRAADYRCKLLNEAKEKRIELDLKRKQWFDESSRLSPRSREYLKQPSFENIRIQRVFSHREMIEQTKKKYMQLPEVKEKIYNEKRKSSSISNNLMKNVFKRKLQESALKGRVSINHHKNILDL